MIRLKIPNGTYKDWEKKATVENRKILVPVCWFAILAELFNLYRVLVASSVGLGTLNNRIYFSFYVFLLLWAVICLAIGHRWWKKEDLKKELVMQQVAAGSFLLWHSLLNAYDLYSDGESQVTVMVVTALVAVAALFWMNPIYAIVNLVLNYSMFMLLTRVSLSSGVGFNLTITLLLTVLIYVVRFQHICGELEQDAKMREASKKLENRDFWLTREQYELVSQSVGFINFQWDVAKDTIDFSKGWKETFELPTHIENLTDFVRYEETLSQAHKEAITECMEKARNRVPYQSLELLFTVKSGEQRWFKLRVALQNDENGEPRYAVGMLDDITERKAWIQQLEQEAKNDLLTGILNRSALEAYGKMSLERMTGKQCVVMIIFDLDDFKWINDAYGHPCGDHVLRTIADILREKAPRSSRAGRLGGDEFVVIATIEHEIEEIKTYIWRVMREAARIRWNDKNLGVRCSVGMAVAEDQSWSYFRLYQAADEALYEAKRRGKNQICTYTDREKKIDA